MSNPAERLRALAELSRGLAGAGDLDDLVRAATQRARELFEAEGCALLLLDAHQSGGAPGTLRVLEPTLPDLSLLDPHALRDYFADTHYATPLRALALLEQLGRLPRRIAVIGCEPAEHEALALGLSAPVAAAIEHAEVMASAWIMSRVAEGPRS